MKERVPFWLCLVFIILSLTACKDDDDDSDNGLTYQLIDGGTAYGVISYDRRASVVIIPATYKGLFVTSIGEKAFKGCTGLILVSIPASVTSIGNFAFNDCSNLISIIIPSSVREIGNAAFRDCTSMTSLAISEGVASIGEYAFDHCINLVSITIPASVTSIGRYAFYQWDTSQTIYIQGYANEAAADAVYDSSWRSSDATFVYQGT